MKRILCVVAALCILFAGCADKEYRVGEKLVDHRGADDYDTAEQCAVLSEEEILEGLHGLTNTELHALWGEPDGSLSGMWGDIWEIGDNRAVIVYFDANGMVENVKFASQDKEDASQIVTGEQMQMEQKAVWGITLAAKDVTASGLTIVCTQSGGEPTGELQTGSWYTVQRLEDGEWKKVEYTEIDEEQVGWTMEAWGIPKDGTVEWQVDWSWLYDELPAGQYRIGKEIMDFREAGDYDEAVIYAEFTLK